MAAFTAPQPEAERDLGSPRRVSWSQNEMWNRVYVLCSFAMGKVGLETCSTQWCHAQAQDALASPVRAAAGGAIGPVRE